MKHIVDRPATSGGASGKLPPQNI